MATKDKQDTCPHCGSTDTRPSRIHNKDTTFQALIFSPYRCRNCRKRHWVLSRRFKKVSITGLAVSATVILVIAALSYLTPIASKSLDAMVQSDQMSDTRKLADQGNADAQYTLGIMYLEGDGVAPIKSEAIKWLSAAATQGHQQAQNDLVNTILRYGAQDSLELKQATQILTQAAQEGQAEAQFMLGSMYAEGQGVIQDFMQAAHWLLKAANAGHPEAMHHLGMMYMIGNGVPKNRTEAYIWFNLAAAEGNQQAFIARADVAKLLSAEQIDEAQTRSREWQATPSATAGNDATSPNTMTQVDH